MASGLIVPMRRDEYWRLTYRRRRYLEHAPEENLAARATSSATPPGLPTTERSTY
jgi:hypothetical protein